MKLNFWQWVGLTVIVLSLAGIWYMRRPATAPAPDSSVGPPPTMTSAPA